MDREFHIPGTGHIHRAISSFSFLEKALVSVLFTIFIVSAVWILVRVHNNITVTIPAPGGTLSEGIVGTPRFINPLLAQTEADKDLTILVYSGLMRAQSGGELIKDLAESYSISDDGTEYIFSIRKDARFHDATPLTAYDVVFTVMSAQDPRIQSPKQNMWEGITVEALDEYTVRFTLSKGYAGFLGNTTLGILPQHIWGEVAAEDFHGSSYNVHPIGSGPYGVETVDINNDDSVQTYTLRSFAYNTLGAPYISRLVMRIFGNEKDLLDAYEQGKIEAFHGIDAFVTQRVLKTNDSLLPYPLPRTFGVFLNHNKKEIFTNVAVRKALSHALDRQEILKTVLDGFGTPLYDPLPPYITNSIGSSKTHTVEEARALLEADGWKRDAESGVYMKKDTSLSFTIKTVNSPELKLVAEFIQSQWNALGASVSVELFDLGQLDQMIIQPRDYDALLFGQALGRDADPYPFWHSSQRNAPGLNIALYTNADVDATLDELRGTLDVKERSALYTSFLDEWRSDVPAIFVYIPDFLYVLPEHIRGVTSGPVQEGAERFLDVNTWYINSQNVFSFLITGNTY
ncbi:MAG: peptide ABC transporter substrate-binding protein [Candidatus Campbellbacteria bacterium]|nr:peptide ABC transporter substrate-binding protein [Candidatus Campbellbacteria bacterium]